MENNPLNISSQESVSIDDSSQELKRPAARLNSPNLHSKQPSSIAIRLRMHGVDWVKNLAEAIKANDERRIATWLELLPYLVVSQGHNKKFIRGRRKKTSKAAMEALAALEQQR